MFLSTNILEIGFEFSLDRDYKMYTFIHLEKPNQKRHISFDSAEVLGEYCKKEEERRKRQLKGGMSRGLKYKIALT
jgi:hypothetical protein